MKKIVILGASGSIGQQTINICKAHRDKLEVVGISVGKNIDYLKEILPTLDIKYVCTMEEHKELAAIYPDKIFYHGDEGLVAMSMIADYDMLVNALVGFTGFLPTLRAIENKKDIALANKETLVAGGDIINKAIKDNGVKLFPIDSEHSAIFQCLHGNDDADIRKLIITGSGGSFRDLPLDKLKDVTLKDALKHPVWSMGNKITIDSATMMNKGFEIIEAHHLFNVDYEDIEVILHKESIVHSMVEFNDGSVLAQMSNPDMHLPIQYALLYTSHAKNPSYKKLDLAKIGSLNFSDVDYKRYPLLKLAIEVGSKGGNLGSVLNGANDTAVELFLEEKISFLDIQKSVIQCVAEANFIQEPSFDDIMESHEWAINYVLEMWKG